MIEPADLTDEMLAGYFGEHCECRPLDHAYPVDTQRIHG